MIIKPIPTRYSLGFLLVLSLILPITSFPIFGNAWGEPANTTEIIDLDSGKISGLLVGRIRKFVSLRGFPMPPPLSATCAGDRRSQLSPGRAFLNAPPSDRSVRSRKVGLASPR